MLHRVPEHASVLSIHYADSPGVVCVLQLAARIAVSNLHKNTLKSFSET